MKNENGVVVGFPESQNAARDKQLLGKNIWRYPFSSHRLDVLIALRAIRVGETEGREDGKTARRKHVNAITSKLEIRSRLKD